MGHPIVSLYLLMDVPFSPYGVKCAGLTLNLLRVYYRNVKLSAIGASTPGSIKWCVAT